jgi:hypothetical protein
MQKTRAFNNGCDLQTVFAFFQNFLKPFALVIGGIRWRKTMLTQVASRSKYFPPYDDEEEQINPGTLGKQLAEYLVDKLKQHGIETEEIIAEDWKDNVGGRTTVS